jgi:hypothetical protein
VRLRIAALLILPLALIAAGASPAAAQIRIYPPYYPAPYPYGYPYRYYSGPEADLRLDIKPKQAAVYVDGYFAGQVDDYDGVFQRLHLAPGTHELVVYLQGYRSLHEKLYLGPNTSRKISAKLEPLRPGEVNEPIPVPVEPPPADGDDRPMPRQFPPRGPGRYPPPPDGRGPAGSGPGGIPDGRDQGTVGSVVIRVQPGGSDVVIDGEHWSAPARADDRLVVQLEAGHHVIEVHKTGYRDLRTEVDVRSGETAPVNVSLTPNR